MGKRIFNFKTKKNSKGNRKFTSNDIENFSKIYFLVKQKGYTIQGAKDYLKNNIKSHTKLDVINRLNEIKSKLIEIRDQI